MSFALSIGAIPDSGYVGDQFRFVGILTSGGWPMAGIAVELIHGYVKVGEGVTGANGDYEMIWTADVTGIRPFHTRNRYLPVTSETITVEVLSPVQEVVKVGKLEIHYFRLIGSSDVHIESLCVNKATEILDSYVTGAYAANPRIVKASGVFQKCVLDVYEPVEAAMLGSVVLFDPVTIALIIAAILTALGITWMICYRVKYLPAAQALQEIGKTLVVVKTELDQALEQGKIDQGVYDSVIDKIDEAARKAEEYGENGNENWFKYFQPILDFMKYIPWIIGGGIALYFLPQILALFPRKRRD